MEAGEGKRCFNLAEAESAYLKYMILRLKLMAVGDFGIFEVTDSFPYFDFKPPHRGTLVGEFWSDLQTRILSLASFILSPFEYLGQRPWGLRELEIAIEELEKTLEELPGLIAEYNSQIQAIDAEIAEIDERIEGYKEILYDPETDLDTFWETWELWAVAEEQREDAVERRGVIQAELDDFPTIVESVQQELADAEQDKIDFENEELDYSNLNDLLTWLEAPLPYITGVGDSFRARNNADIADYEYRKLRRGDFFGDWIVEDINTCLDNVEYLRGVPNNYIQNNSVLDTESKTANHVVVYVPWDHHYAGDTFYGTAYWPVQHGPTHSSSTVDDAAAVSAFTSGMTTVDSNFNTYLNDVIIPMIEDYENALKNVKISKDLSEPPVVLDDMGFPTPECDAAFAAWDATFKGEYQVAEAVWDRATFIIGEVDIDISDVREISPSFVIENYYYLNNDTNTARHKVPREKAWLHDSGVPPEDPCGSNYEYEFNDGFDVFYTYYYNTNLADERYHFDTVGDYFSTGLVKRVYTYKAEYYEDGSYNINNTTDYEKLPTVEMADSFSVKYGVEAKNIQTEAHEATGDYPAYTSRWVDRARYGSAEAQTFLKLN